MAFVPVVCWSTPTHSCLLRRTDGDLELLLYRDGHAIRLQTCESEGIARHLAFAWRLALAEAEGVILHPIVNVPTQS